MKIEEIIKWMQMLPPGTEAEVELLITAYNPPGERKVPASGAERARRYRRRHPDRLRPWSRHDYDAVFERDGERCRYCGATERLEIDHVVPRSRGGSDDAENLVVACRSCNSRKKNRTPEEAGMVLL